MGGAAIGNGINLSAMADLPEVKTRPRKNSRYYSMNLLDHQAERFDKLIAESGETRNSLLRLIAEKMKLSDIRVLQKRR